jgi:RNA polymerase sigma factor (TIGR02999 family)
MKPGACQMDAALALLYDELRAVARQLLARERPGITLQPTSLVHEAWLRLLAREHHCAAEPGETPVFSGAPRFTDRKHFLSAAAIAMRCALVDRARAAAAEKRGGGKPALDAGVGTGDWIDRIEVPAARGLSPEDLEVLEASLAAMERHNQRWAQVVHLRFFLDLSVEETAAALDLSPTPVKGDWAFARAWLMVAIREARGEPTSATQD